MSGLMTEALAFVGHHQWVVPVFLFRNQEDARQYIYVLSREPSLTREILGRKGDDFIGIVVNDDSPWKGDRRPGSGRQCGSRTAVTLKACFAAINDP